MRSLGAPVATSPGSFLGGWLGIGRIVVGMARQGYDLQLTRYGDEGWRATFYPAGRGHSVTSAVGSAWEREPWKAVQQAARSILRRAEEVRRRAAGGSRSLRRAGTRHMGPVSPAACGRRPARAPVHRASPAGPRGAPPSSPGRTRRFGAGPPGSCRCAAARGPRLRACPSLGDGAWAIEQSGQERAPKRFPKGVLELPWGTGNHRGSAAWPEGDPHIHIGPEALGAAKPTENP